VAKANLDALIPREDFAVDGGSGPQSLSDTIKATDLVKGEGFFYSSLRKPDFQRETADWDGNKISAFVKSFIDGDLIPSIILWQAGQYTFVIDGAHRLSALISWVNNDYGDGFISQAFFGHEVDSEQKKVADQTGRLVKKQVGSYQDYIAAIKSPEQADATLLANANKLGFLSLQLQWVTGTAAKAEASFFTINQKATPISDTEIALLKARKKPYAMASRAIIRSGSGHKYWHKFDESVRSQIESMAKDINKHLFMPEMKNPIKTLDLPLAGKGYSTRSLPLVFELVRMSNDVEQKTVDEDVDGKDTLTYLKNTSKVVRRFTTQHASSLGLHPAIYFYSEKGRYQPTAFMAWIKILKDFEKSSSFDDFIKSREKYEKALIKFKNLTNQSTVKYGSGSKGYKQLADIYRKILALVQSNIAIENIGKKLKEEFPFLNMEYSGDDITSSDFSSGTKSQAFLTEALVGAPTCKICKGYIHVNSISIDHIERKEDGGTGEPANAQLAHPYCNSTFKN